MKHVRITAAILVVLAILPLTAVLAWAGTETALPVEYPTCYQQTDKRWADKELIGPNGCGLISLVNAVHYITGNFIDPVPLAIYAHEIDAYNGSVGGGTARWGLYGNLKNYEEKYGFRVDNAGKDAGVTNKAFIEHLEQGGVAICHVYGHFIAIMDYDPQNNTYLVYDCAANLQKRFSYPRATWLTQAKLTKSQYMTVDWWCLLSATKVARNSFDGGTSAINREATGTVCARAGEKASLSGTVSHTDGVAMAAVSGGIVGVDVQTARAVSSAVKERVCSAAELSEISCAEDVDLAFAAVWAKKESYVKSLGQGIATDLSALNFACGAPQPAGLRFVCGLFCGAPYAVCLREGE